MSLDFRMTNSWICRQNIIAQGWNCTSGLWATNSRDRIHAASMIHIQRAWCLCKLWLKSSISPSPRSASRFATYICFVFPETNSHLSQRKSVNERCSAFIWLLNWFSLDFIMNTAISSRMDKLRVEILILFSIPYTTSTYITHLTMILQVCLSCFLRKSNYMILNMR